MGQQAVKYLFQELQGKGSGYATAAQMLLLKALETIAANI